jgi:hypothetical protein
MFGGLHDSSGWSPNMGFRIADIDQRFRWFALGLLADAEF